MEGVGARLGRSSTRYGPTTVFNGPVRKWKKKWVHVSASTTVHHHASQTNGTNGSHLLLYKWAPISHNSNNNGTNGDKTPIKEDNAASAEESPPKKFKYVPIAVLEEQRKEEMDDIEEEDKPSDSEQSEKPPSKSDDVDGKPDINDVPMEEAQAPDKDQQVAQDLNESSLDLSLGLKGHDEDVEVDPKPEDEDKEGQ